jgi:hypothetical protein
MKINHLATLPVILASRCALFPRFGMLRQEKSGNPVFAVKLNVKKYL